MDFVVRGADDGSPMQCERCGIGIERIDPRCNQCVELMGVSGEQIERGLFVGKNAEAIVVAGTIGFHHPEVHAGSRAIVTRASGLRTLNALLIAMATSLSPMARRRSSMAAFSRAIQSALESFSTLR